MAIINREKFRHRIEAIKENARLIKAANDLLWAKKQMEQGNNNADEKDGLNEWDLLQTESSAVAMTVAAGTLLAAFSAF